MELMVYVVTKSLKFQFKNLLLNFFRISLLFILVFNSLSFGEYTTGG
jgi:hypothetical protein